MADPVRPVGVGGRPIIIVFLGGDVFSQVRINEHFISIWIISSKDRVDDRIFCFYAK